MLHIVQQKQNNQAIDKNSYVTLLENTRKDIGVSNIKFGKLFHQDVTDERKNSTHCIIICLCTANTKYHEQWIIEIRDAFLAYFFLAILFP